MKINIKNLHAIVQYVQSVISNVQKNMVWYKKNLNPKTKHLLLVKKNTLS